MKNILMLMSLISFSAYAGNIPYHVKCVGNVGTTGLRLKLDINSKNLKTSVVKRNGSLAHPVQIYFVNKIGPDEEGVFRVESALTGIAFPGGGTQFGRLVLNKFNGTVGKWSEGFSGFNETVGEHGEEVTFSTTVRCTIAE